VPRNYGLIGNPNRCPTLEARQFIAADGHACQHANGNFAADSMVADACAPDETRSRPTRGKTRGMTVTVWRTRTKCQGTFGNDLHDVGMASASEHPA
jgi:hypothetical protein